MWVVIQVFFTPCFAPQFKEKNKTKKGLELRVHADF
jgi:hypothetical protein